MVVEISLRLEDSKHGERRAAVNSLVVVLPMLPVMPTTLGACSANPDLASAWSAATVSGTRMRAKAGLAGGMSWDMTAPRAPLEKASWTKPWPFRLATMAKKSSPGWLSREPMLKELKRREGSP